MDLLSQFRNISQDIKPIVYKGELGGKEHEFHMRRIAYPEQIAVEKKMKEAGDDVDQNLYVSAEFFASVSVNEKGERVCTDEQVKDRQYIEGLMNDVAFSMTLDKAVKHYFDEIGGDTTTEKK